MNVKSPTFFAAPAAFRTWLKKHGAKADELLLGFRRKGKDKVKDGITYAEALDEALCVGWIDGVRKGLDEDSYTIRFTPRRKSSVWSLINVRHVERLIAAKRMQPAGLAAFEARKPEKTGIYSFEKAAAQFDAKLEKKFRAAKKAWAFWEAQPPGYRRTATHWVTSAKQEETRERRLGLLIGDSVQGLRLAELVGRKRTKE